MHRERGREGDRGKGRVVGREGGREGRSEGDRGRGRGGEGKTGKVRTRGDEKDHKKAKCMHKHKHTQWTPHSTLYMCTIHSGLYTVTSTCTCIVGSLATLASSISAPSSTTTALALCASLKNAATPRLIVPRG